ncbi:hypothetical protein [Streptomyces purpurascens]|uniref:Uncharacterized protein n=1 Tax=Streptomyces purpurascens TaxID=1924 RepID=A0ABZ1MH71_STREF|nr:hypothetical protein [Streptomyces purpurascens]MCE7049577.1 hypothetical protein [Streptomyces purpurascens]GHA22706.1 hypothetical protein GCM10010303_36560 [Streptomyces purpurascens]
MTTTEPETETPTEDDELQALGEQLLHTARTSPVRTVVQALVEEQTILSAPAVRQALILHTDDGEMAHLEGLAGHVFSLGLDKGQRSFLCLVLSMVGIGMTAIAAVRELDERQLQILLRAILRLAGNDTIAVGTRLPLRRNRRTDVEGNDQ